MSGISADPKTTSGPWYENIPEIGNTGVETWKLGMWIFLASEIMFFTGLIGSYIVLRLGAANWPHPEEILAVEVLGLNTFILIVSSVTMVLGLHAIQHDQNKKAMLYLLATAVLGSCFLAIKLWDYHHMWTFHHAPYEDGFKITTNLLGSVYYTLTAFHGLHVLIGVIALVLAALGCGSGKFGSKRFGAIENIGLYWHFVDLIWIILFAILCLV